VAVDRGVVEINMAGVSDGFSGLGVIVAGISPACVGGSVAVTKPGWGEAGDSTSTEIQDVSRTMADRRIIFLQWGINAFILYGGK
jgi:hypothetical protein